MTEQSKQAKITELKNERVDLEKEKSTLQLGHPLLKELRHKLLLKKKSKPIDKLIKKFSMMPIITLILPVIIFQFEPLSINEEEFSNNLAYYAIFVAIMMPLLQNHLNKVNYKNDHEKTEKYLQAILYQLYTNDKDLNSFKTTRDLIDGSDCKADVEKNNEARIKEINERLEVIKSKLSVLQSTSN
ncbi:hypothetical protein [Exiguobacterium sp. s28]|uniref:hypothetical protein n=1 Tax=Exiguobacterium sp. s28 TaxID=2751238 RepID=UPI001BEC0335|nr:hypothetical protein [Exiguobacterium sp. s28]